MIFGLTSSSYSFGFNLTIILVYALALLVALISHEIAHGFVALKMGDPTAKMMGRLSVNPVKHIDPVGLLFMCIMGIGWAKPVPVNPFNYRNFRKGNFWVSSAGIITNLILGFVFSLFYFLMYKFADPVAIESNIALFALYHFFLYAMLLNIVFMVFNLLPIYPLDGYNMLVSVTKPSNGYMRFVRQHSMWILPVLLIVLYMTDALFYAYGGVISGFLWFWELIF